MKISWKIWKLWHLSFPNFKETFFVRSQNMQMCELMSLPHNNFIFQQMRMLYTRPKKWVHPIFFKYLKKYFTDFDHSNGNGYGIFLHKKWVVYSLPIDGIVGVKSCILWQKVWEKKSCTFVICVSFYTNNENHACFWTFKHHLLHVTLMFYF